jgi:outer membrane protein assembly factor BamB
MKRLISNFLLLASLIVISNIFYRCTAPDTGSKSVQINNNQLISEWREENRTGVSAETGLLESWPDSGPEIIWSNTELPKGYSSPSFGNNTIYVTGNDHQNDILVALDPYGKITWRTTYGRSWNGATPESRCTPTVEGNRVYVSSGFGDLACIDGTSGEIIWSIKASEVYKGTYGEWGIAESLLIDGDKAYFTTGGPETTTIALNKNTGDLIWKSASINDAPAYVSPILIDYANKKLIVNVSLHHVFAVDASDGTVVWKIKHTEALDSKKSTIIWPDAPLIKCVTPLYHDGKIYVTGGYDHGGLMLNLTDSGHNVAVAWTDTVLDVHHGGVVLVDGYIYGANWLNNSDGNWCCIDWNTGKKMWEEHWKCKGSIISAEGLLYIYEEKSGYVGLVRPNPEKFDLISSFKVPLGSGPHWAHPVINNGNLYIRHGNALMVFNIKK